MIVALGLELAACAGGAGSAEEGSVVVTASAPLMLATAVPVPTSTTTASADNSSRAVILPIEIDPNLVLCPVNRTFPSFTHKFKEDALMTRPTAITNRGVVVGALDPGGGRRRQGFVRQPNGSLQVFSSNQAGVEITGANDLGKMVGWAGDTGFFDALDNDHRHVGYIPIAINNRGDIIGRDLDYHGFLRSGVEQQIISLGNFRPIAINNFGQIVGYERSDNSVAVVRQPNGDFTPLPQIRNKFAPFPIAINDLGQISGSYIEGARTRGFILDANGATTLVDGPNEMSIAVSGLNNLGHVVGYVTGDIVMNFVRSRDGDFNFHFVGGPLGALSVAGIGINDLGQEIGRFQPAGSNVVQTGFVSGPFFIEPFGRFTLTKTDIALGTGGLTVWGSYTLCATRPHNPIVDPVILKVFRQDSGWATIAIPVGSFVYQPGKLEFHGVLHGVTVDAIFWGPLANNSWDFRIFASGVVGLPSTRVVDVFLAVGDSIGSTSTTATFLP